MATDAQKAKKFQELAEKRVSKILKGLEGLTKLSATARYSYTPKQVEAMATAIQKAGEHCFNSFKTGGAKSAEGFKF